MKKLLAFILTSFVLLGFSQERPIDLYNKAKVIVKKATITRDSGDLLKSIEQYTKALFLLKKLKEDYPYWDMLILVDIETKKSEELLAKVTVAVERSEVYKVQKVKKEADAKIEKVETRLLKLQQMLKRELSQKYAKKVELNDLQMKLQDIQIELSNSETEKKMIKNELKAEKSKIKMMDQDSSFLNSELESLKKNLAETRTVNIQSLKKLSGLEQLEISSQEIKDENLSLLERYNSLLKEKNRLEDDFELLASKTNKTELQEKNLKDILEESKLNKEKIKEYEAQRQNLTQKAQKAEKLQEDLNRLKLDFKEKEQELIESRITLEEKLIQFQKRGEISQGQSKDLGVLRAKLEVAENKVKTQAHLEKKLLKRILDLINLSNQRYEELVEFKKVNPVERAAVLELTIKKLDSSLEQLKKDKNALQTKLELLEKGNPVAFQVISPEMEKELNAMKENFGVARAESKALTEQLRAEILLKEKALGQLELYAQKDKNRQEILVRKKNDKDKLRNQLEESQKNLNIMQQELSRFVKQEKTDTLFKKKYKDLEVHLFNRDKETLLLKESLVSQKGKLDQLQAYLNIKNKQIKNFQEKFLNLKENYLALEKNGATAQLKKKWDNLVAEQKKLKKQLSKENQEKLALQKKLEIKVLALKAESQKGAQWQGKWEKAMTDLEQVQKEMNPLKGDLKTKSSTLVKVLAERDEWNSKLSEENKKLLIANGMYKELSKANSQLKSKFKKLTSMLTTSEKTNQGLKKKIKEILKKKAN